VEETEECYVMFARRSLFGVNYIPTKILSAIRPSIIGSFIIETGVVYISLC